MTNQNKKNKKPKNNDIGWAKAFRDIVVTSMNKGQFPILCIFIPIFIILWRLPEKDLSDIVLKMVDYFAKGELVSYVLLLAVLIGWFVQAKTARTYHTEEMNRVAQEKSRLQNELAKKNFKSSEE